jgi:hypothetical protein
MNIALRIVENIQAILLACPVNLLNMSIFETLARLYLICRHVMLVSFVYTNTQGLAKDRFNNVGNIKRQETETSVFKS